MKYSLPLLLVGSLFLAWCGTPAPVVPNEEIQDTTMTGTINTNETLTGSELLSGEMMLGDENEMMTGSMPLYTLEEISLHTNKESGCWTAINGKVYDVTAMVASHKGGSAAIINLCGVDGSASFEKWHGGEQKIADILATSQIGLLAL